MEILQNSSRKHKVVVVLSAFGGVADDLRKAGELAAAGDESYLELLGAMSSATFQRSRNSSMPRNRPLFWPGPRWSSTSLEDVLNGAYLVKELSHKTCDFVVSFGGQLSCYIITQALQQSRVKANSWMHDRF